MADHQNRTGEDRLAEVMAAEEEAAGEGHVQGHLGVTDVPRADQGAVLSQQVDPPAEAEEKLPHVVGPNPVKKMEEITQTDYDAHCFLTVLLL